MTFGVFNIVNLKKGRTAGSGKTKYVAIYDVTTRAGKTYPQYFYAKDSGRIGTWLALQHRRGNVAVARDLTSPHRFPANTATEKKGAPRPYAAAGTTIAPPPTSGPSSGLKFSPAGIPVPLEGATSVSVAEVEARRADHENNIRYTYVRLGDKLKQLDPVGYDAAKKVVALGAQRDVLISKIGNATAKLAEHKDSQSLLEAKADLQVKLDKVKKDLAALFPQVNKRPLATKLLRVLTLQQQVEQLREEGREWIKQNPEKWALYLKEHEAASKKIRALGEKPKSALEFPPHIEQQLTNLKWKLKGTKGLALVVPTKAPKLGVGERLIITESADINDLDPQSNPLAYALSSGWRGERLPESGRNWFTPGQRAALFKEFDSDIRNIARGRAFGTNKMGWGTILDSKELAKDIESDLRIKLNDIAETYTAHMASTGRDSGSNFRFYALSLLKKTAQNTVRSALADAIHAGTVEPEILHEIGGALTWNEEGAFTSSQLREHTDALGTPYTSAEDIVAIKDVQRIVETRLSPIAAIGLMSRLNLHNPDDTPSGGGGLKDWTSVAKDVAGYLKKTKHEGPSVAHIKGMLTRNLSSLTRVAGDGFAAGLRPSEKEGLKEGIRALIRVSAFRRASIPGTQAWERIHEPTQAAKHKQSKPGESTALPLHAKISRQVNLKPPVTGHSAKQHPLIAHPKVREAHDFWAAQARNVAGQPVSTNRAPHFDPASQLDLGMGHVAPAGLGMTPQLRLKQLRGIHLMKVWRKLSKLGSWRLAALSTRPEFLKFKDDHHRAQAAAYATHDAKVADMPTGAKVRTPISTAFTVQKKGGKVVSIEGASPEVIEQMARLIVQQRAMDNKAIKRPIGLIIKSATRVDPVLAQLLVKLRRVLRGPNGRRT